MTARAGDGVNLARGSVLNVESMDSPKQVVWKHDLARWIVRHFVETGVDATIAEIASALGWPESRARKTESAMPGGFLRFSHEIRPSRSGNYPWMIGDRWHRVMVFGPSRETLGRVLRAMATRDLDSAIESVLSPDGGAS